MYTYTYFSNQFLNEMRFFNVDIKISAYYVDLDVNVKWNYHKYL